MANRVGQQLGIERIDTLGLEQVQAYQAELSPYPDLIGGIDAVVEVLPNVNNMAEDSDSASTLETLTNLTNFMDGQFITDLAGAPDEVLRGRNARERGDILR